MQNNLKKYQQKRNFNETSEPKGKINRSKKKLHFAIQHHLASRDHYDFRLEWKGVLKSWAVPKGPSYNPSDKRLAVEVEDHPFDYRNFEGIIPQGQYGGGTVMLWDEGYWIPLEDPKKGLEEGSLKFQLEGKRLKGDWTLVRMKENNWLLIKEKDEYAKKMPGISRFTKSIKTNRTMDEIARNIKKKKKTIPPKEGEYIIDTIKITSPEKLIFEEVDITKKEIAEYYSKVAERMLPYVKGRILSTIRCPEGTNKECFFKKHLSEPHKGLKQIMLENDKDNKEDYYAITNHLGILSEVQLNAIEFHVWGSKVRTLEKPDVMVFDLDPDESLNLSDVRQGVKDLKSILDELSLVSFLKTSGGKGYHIVVPFKPNANWETFRAFAKRIAEIMVEKWPDRYVSNVRMVNRKNKIFIDWIRNTRSSTSVAPYSIRARKKATVSMPIRWSELEKVKPDGITIEDAIKRLKRKDPWEGFFSLEQTLKQPNNSPK